MRKATGRTEIKPGDLIPCVLCGGDGVLDEPYEGRDDCICPCCQGTGKIQHNPGPPSPKDEPHPTDWTCICGWRMRHADLYCWECQRCRDSAENRKATAEARNG